MVYSQRSGPTPEDNALAVSLMQKALQDASSIEAAGVRSAAIAEVFQGAGRMEEATGQMAVRREQAAKLLHQAFLDAAGLPDGQMRIECLREVYRAAEPIASDEAASWVRELKSRKLREAVLPPLPQPTEAEEVVAVATEDLQEALRRCEMIADKISRTQAKAALAQKLLRADTATREGRRLADQAASLADLAPSEQVRASLHLMVARAFEGGDPQQCLARLQRACRATRAMRGSPELQAHMFVDLARIAEDEPSVGAEAPLPPGPPPNRGASEELRAFAEEAMLDARAAALRIPEMRGEEANPERREVLQQVVEFELGRAKSGDPESRRRHVMEALDTARSLRPGDNLRVRSLAQAACRAGKWDKALATKLLDEANAGVQPIGASLDAAMARVEVIGNAAMLGDERCWEWAVEAAQEGRRARWPEDELDGVPVELAQSLAEAAVLGATLATGDFQRSKKFIKKNAQLGGYEAGQALWAAVVYVWDPSRSFDLAEDLLKNLARRDFPTRGSLAALAAVPAFVHHMFVPDAEGVERAYPLFDRALEIACASKLPEDMAFACAMLAAAASATDGERAARAVAGAGEGLRQVAEPRTRDGLAVPVCVLVAVADPRTAADLTAVVDDPEARCHLRIRTADAMLFDPAKTRGDALGI